MQTVTSLRNQILTLFSSKKLISLENARRHILKHFKEKSKIKNTVFTVSIEEVSQTVIGGYFLQVNAVAPLKNLQMASEGYSLDERSAHLLSPVLYALIYLYVLDLTHVPTTFHITSQKALDLLLHLPSDYEKDDPITKAVKLLVKELPSVAFTACLKGPFFEKIQTKMARIKLKDSNELTSLDFKVIANCLNNYNT